MPGGTFGCHHVGGKATVTWRLKAKDAVKHPTRTAQLRPPPPPGAGTAANVGGAVAEGPVLG